MNASTRAVDVTAVVPSPLVAAAAVVVAGVGFGAIQALSEDDATVTPASGGEFADDVYADFLNGRGPDA